MSISILNRGASGGLKPELTVTAPAGSTIDLLQNSVIVDTYTLGAGETEHTFVVELGTYTVRGTLGEETKSEEVLVDAVGQYAVGIDYKLWLYRNGDECEDVTGGWVFGSNDTASGRYDYYGNGGSYSRTKNADNIKLIANRTSTSTSSAATSVSTANAVNLSGCSEVKIKATITDSSNETRFPWNAFLCVSPTSIVGVKLGETTITKYVALRPSESIFSLDISDYTDGFISIICNIYGNVASTVSAQIEQIWLE